MTFPTNPVIGELYIDAHGVSLEYLREKQWVVVDSYPYARVKRKEAYPSIGDQLDMIFHAGQGGDEFQAAIQAVKDAYPKPITPEE